MRFKAEPCTRPQASHESEPLGLEAQVLGILTAIVDTVPVPAWRAASFLQHLAEQVPHEGVASPPARESSARVSFSDIMLLWIFPHQGRVWINPCHVGDQDEASKNPEKD